MNNLYKIEARIDLKFIMQQMIDFVRIQSKYRIDSNGDSSPDTRIISIKVGRQNGHTTSIIELLKTYEELNPIVITPNTAMINGNFFPMMNKIYPNITKDDMDKIFYSSARFIDNKNLTDRKFLGMLRPQPRLIFIDPANRIRKIDMDEIIRIFANYLPRDAILVEVS